jgi:hypothetical protein
MTECQNCGSHVTPDYARVFTPENVENPQVCPHCEDMKRDPDGTAREKKT